MIRVFSWCLLYGLSLQLHAFTKDKIYRLTILHTNDHHGRFWANRDGEYGLAARATLINSLRQQIRQAGGEVLLLDAGDVNTGIPQSDMLEAEPDFKGMALLGYDVMAVGNHEFDNPLATIFKQQAWAGFPFVSANIYRKSSNERVFPSHVDKVLGDLKVTIMGLTTEDTPLKSNPVNSQGLYFKPVVEEARTLVPELRPRTDVLIAVTHMGHYPDESHGADAPGDVTLARRVPGIDLIVGGHTEKPLFNSDLQNGTIIVQAENWGKYVGRVDLEFLNGKVELKNYELIPVNLKNSTLRIAQDPEVEAFLRPFKEKGDATLQVKIGEAEVDFIGDRDVIRSRETNLGNLVTKAYKEKFKADMAILNSGGIRASMPSGKITYETVLTILPFGGEIVTAELTGKELHSYLESVVINQTAGSGSFPQMSGVSLTVDSRQKTIHGIKINGNRLCLKKTYLVALPEFIAAGGDKYPVLAYRKHGYVDADILKDYILTQQKLNASNYPIEGYIRIE